MQQLTNSTAVLKQPIAVNDPLYYLTAEKLEILESFGFRMDQLDFTFDKTWTVFERTEVWLHTGHEDFDEALDVALFELQERCYLPSPYDIKFYGKAIGVENYNHLQDCIKVHGRLAASSIEKAISIFFLLNNILPNSLDYAHKIDVLYGGLQLDIMWECGIVVTVFGSPGYVSARLYSPKETNNSIHLVTNSDIIKIKKALLAA